MHIVEDHIEKANNVVCEEFYTPPQSPSALIDVDAQVDVVASFVKRQTSVMLELHKKKCDKFTTSVL
jgi:hypothetical protein